MSNGLDDPLCRPSFSLKNLKFQKIKNPDAPIAPSKPSTSERRVEATAGLKEPSRPKPRRLPHGVSRVSPEDHPEPMVSSPITVKKPTPEELKLSRAREHATPVTKKTKTRPENSFPSLSPLEKGRKPRAKKTPSIASPKRKTHKSPGAFPALSPLSSAALKDSAKPVARRKTKATPLVCAPFPLDELRTDDDDELALKDGEEILVRGGLRPFPMNIGSQLSPPRKKRLSSNHADGSARKKRTWGLEKIVLSDMDDGTDDDAHAFLDPSTDPRTLCPYCDAPLPSSATTTLISLLASAAAKSHSDPRPTNPLGRRAKLASFIGVCQRHRFESEILPEGEARGWPKEIKWNDVRGRVEGMVEHLSALIADGAHEMHGQRKKDKGPRAKCVFWGDVVKEVKEQGSRAVIGMKGQFASFEKTQPGYYGELGAVIIHQTLYNLFPPTSIDAILTAPLTPNEFIQRILVPEVGVRLIMQDKDLKGDKGVEEAVTILRESATYGVAMFPEDGGGRTVAGAQAVHDDDDGEMGAADMIVMERARKRRKELEEEEEREEEILGRQKARVEREQNERVTDKRKARKGKQRAVSSRPKPKPLIPRIKPLAVTDGEGVTVRGRKARAASRAVSETSDVLDLCSSDSGVRASSSDESE